MRRAPILDAALALALVAASAASAAHAETVHPKSHLVKMPSGACEIRFRLIPSEGFDAAKLVLYLGVTGGRDFLALGVEDGKLVVGHVRGGKPATLARGGSPRFTPGTESSLYARLRAGRLTVHDGSTRLIELPLPPGIPAAGARCGMGPCPNVAFRKPLVQPVGEVLFTDDFMRDARLGAWRRHGGAWTVSRVANAETSVQQAFSLRFSGAQAGAVSSGQWFWSDYVASVSARPGARGSTVALGFYWRGPGDYFALRCSGANAGGGGRIELLRMAAGKEQVLASTDGALRAGQWYRLKVVVQGGSALAYVDDRLVARSTDPGLTGGRVAMLAGGGPSSFDDVVIAGVRAPQAEVAVGAGKALESALRLAEGEVTGVTEVFSERPTMKEWATSSGRWRRRGAFSWAPTVYFGPTSVLWRPAAALEHGTFALAVAEAGGNGGAKAGLRANVSVDRDFGSTVASLHRDGRALARQRLAPEPVREVRAEITPGLVRVSAGKGGVEAEVNGPAGGYVLGYRISGPAAERSSRLKVSSPRVFDYTFSRAPSDWLSAGGTWRSHVRWTCDPRWSWFGGWDERGPAWLWNKRSFGGDVSAEAHCAFMMLREGWPQGYLHPFNVRIALSATGTDASSGYVFVYRNVDGPSEILRMGKVVARSEKYIEALYPAHNATRVERVHRRWMHVQAVRQGATLRLYVDGEPLIEYTDPEPLDGNMVGFGTERNGICLARVVISAEKPGAKGLFMQRGAKK